MHNALDNDRQRQFPGQEVRGADFAVLVPYNDESVLLGIICYRIPPRPIGFEPPGALSSPVRFADLPVSIRDLPKFRFREPQRACSLWQGVGSVTLGATQVSRTVFQREDCGLEGFSPVEAFALRLGDRERRYHTRRDPHEVVARYLDETETEGGRPFGFVRDE